MTETPAETIRRAAKLMRERAEKATPGPWLGVIGKFKDGGWPCVITTQGDPKDVATWLLGAGDGGVNGEADAAQAGSWHPLVAAAVADWLDSEAERAERPHALLLHSLSPGPLAVAHAYLGEAGA